MILRTNTKTAVYPENLHRPCTRAEHAVAVQAERDSRRYIPTASGRLRSSGKVYGNTIVWNPPYARIIYFGYVYVDPKYKKGGFIKKQTGELRSRPGIKKVRTNRKFNIRRGTDGWFYDAKKKCIGEWMNIAKEVIERG